MNVIDLGITDFREAYEIQLGLVQKVFEGRTGNTLILTEHRPVITIGRTGSRDNILRSGEFLSSFGMEVLEIDRGGDVTYHGPGQLIAYPIFKLEDKSRDIHHFLYFLEGVGNHFLAQYGFLAEEREGFRGIWVGGKKIGSIGIGVKRWITYHGLAININIDLAPFSFIRPCGIERVQMAALKTLLQREVDIGDAKDKLRLSFEEVSFLAEAVDKE